MGHISRRLLLGGAAATAGVLPLHRWLVHTARAQTQVTRFDLSTTDGRAMLQIYADAVGKMMAMGEGEPRGWLFQWYTHAVRGDRTKSAELDRIYTDSSDPNRALANSMWDTCEAHFDDSRENFFFPWHRMFVLFFEQIIRNVSGNTAFTLPYWNYTDPGNRALPAEFRMRDDPVWGPLFRPDRRNGVNNGRPIDEVGPNPINLDAMRSPVYQDTGNGDAGFCANTDGGVHGAIHVDVGTRVGMGDVPWAANDPIFWLHHCNIDRIWASWNKAGGKNPSDLGFMNETFTFADGGGNRVQSMVADVLDTVPLNYVYDSYLDRPPGSVPFPQPGAVVAFASHASSAQVSGPVALGGAPTTVSLAAPPAPAAKAPGGPSLAVNVRAGRNFYLRLDGLRAATQPDVAYDVYLDLPEGTPPDRSNASYVGSVNFFGAVVHGAHAGHKPAPVAKKSYSLVATDTVRKLQEAGRLTDAPRVTLVPTGAPSQDAAPTINSIALLSSS